ncbi:protein disulfide-isomerase domain [Batrachochytrium salamandrivorans]|nr:protein disulfide-isomerase domain [Batrachochytrium salamandrivorans]
MLPVITFVLATLIGLAAAAGDVTIVGGQQDVLVEFYAPWCGHCKSLEPLYEEVATSYVKHKSSVVIAKVDADAHRSLGDRFGLRASYSQMNSVVPKDYSGGRDVSSISEFIQTNTGLRPVTAVVHKSVKVLTESTFNAEVLESGKNILVEFYAPWCGHCKTLAPIYERLQKPFLWKATYVCVVADLDATTASAISSTYGIESYPTIKFFAAGSAEPVNYEGARDEASLIAFLNEKCGTHRVSGGGLNHNAGRTAKLDAEAAVFMAASTAEQTKMSKVAVAESESTTLTYYYASTRYVKYYSKVMQRTVKDSGFITKEISRLESILSTGNTTPEKNDDFNMRLNILRVFSTAGTTTGSDEL